MLDDCVRRAVREKHGHAVKGSTSPTYFAWQDMRKRCADKSSKDYSLYGGRGISVCEQWHSFTNFLRDMGEKPDGLSLERIHNDKGYSKSNCKWATPAEQSRNTRRNIFIEHDGKRLCLKDAELALGFSVGTIRNRLYRGWPLQKAIATPNLKPNHRRGLTEKGKS